MDIPLHVVLRCDSVLVRKVRYVFDTLLSAAGVDIVYAQQPPAAGPWLLYAQSGDGAEVSDRCLRIVHSPDAWRLFLDRNDVSVASIVDGLAVVLPQGQAAVPATQIGFDIVANAFYFLASWSERVGANRERNRQLYATSVYARLVVPQDIVDRYLARILRGLQNVDARYRSAERQTLRWPDGARYAVVLSHDVDFIAESVVDTLKQGAKTVLRHLVRQRDPQDAMKAAMGLVRAMAAGRDPYSCVHEIIEREKAIGVRSSFQIAVGHRHPNDVNYRIENDRTRDYLRAIPDEGFDLCLHGSYCSSENLTWYQEEVRLLEERLSAPLGSRQHFLSFHYDNLFRAQEQSGVEYDMSMGYPDRVGPRAGFSFPYFPYCIDEDRPYKVLQISLVLMDVTLRGYMNLKGTAAWEAMKDQLDDLREKGGCASVVWHPIVFGGARDPGYEDLFWKLIQYVRDNGGLCTDGGTINTIWRRRAAAFSSFAG